MATIILPDAAATIAFGRSYAAGLVPGSVVALCGDLGAGKTHFVKGMAAGLGAAADVTSPTFTLIHEYLGGRLPLFHFDLYRLDSADELLRIGFDDYLDAGGVLVLEWADKFPTLLPEGTRWLHFVHRGDGGREVIEAAGPP
ncbi:MAG TPA: tRNA (adenosine(37)-N6)-threonylcarbamoyltransferase complex ATPase subunit type 1 TsaE [Chthoniobacteraceae bacterium]|jgi:tRNA threonylcarbamoyladenosine biosynthesis protein TsaE|nr:tRNA (adenosine(37)-N6)-threonylcarbamoyltransferase complex ATPase subunit type 1 TsaE [Chthoniobacteraceae bacterium]